jgi:hypothetical protein
MDGTTHSSSDWASGSFSESVRTMGICTIKNVLVQWAIGVVQIANLLLRPHPLLPASQG